MVHTNNILTYIKTNLLERQKEIFTHVFVIDRKDEFLFLGKEGKYFPFQYKLGKLYIYEHFHPFAMTMGKGRQELLLFT